MVAPYLKALRSPSAILVDGSLVFSLMLTRRGSPRRVETGSAFRCCQLSHRLGLGEATDVAGRRALPDRGGALMLSRSLFVELFRLSRLGIVPSRNQANRLRCSSACHLGAVVAVTRCRRDHAGFSAARDSLIKT